ncbi:hypothetical protein PHSY_006314 [Pseudozyma hubeiensis SY62]|uniref:Uncharacterized protein n=1 Tax=Pseudozyma hubeiensis (strain SY62) TaxID=1305764 RepID=R9PKT2_PSEHS|nr:hypothetical protein PHSY_006314 [Pseudozyma hubeiensis SY62]GAC98720.1 hypothetical protein PHSY_006314 [Pseudozyma hubeiensis SY62]
MQCRKSPRASDSDTLYDRSSRQSWRSTPLKRFCGLKAADQRAESDHRSEKAARDELAEKILDHRLKTAESQPIGVAALCSQKRNSNFIRVKGKTDHLPVDVAAAACVPSYICTLIVSSRSTAWYPTGKPAICVKQEPSQDASRFLLAAQQRFNTGSQSPLSASASADQPGSGYQSSSAQSASGDPTHEESLAFTSAPGSRRPSALSRKPSESHRSQKHKWSAEETQALVDGCNKHGVGNWKKILSDPELSPLFSDRTAGDLKDRFRTYFPDAYHEMYPNAKTHLSKAVRGRDAEGKSIFEKGKTKERRPFTPEEDAALRAGYQQYGSHWALIAKNPIFNGQRRAIDLRDRFRNAFPEDYERAGFKPRPSKARKERGPSAAKPGQGHAARSAAMSGTMSDNSLSEGAWRGSDHPLSDATSDGHLTDHGNFTDYSYFTDQGNLTDGGAEPVLSGPSSGTSSALGRSNSLTHGMPRFVTAQTAQSEQLSFGQALAMQQQQLQSSTQARPPFLSSNTAPLPGAGLPLRATDMVTGQSIHNLFEQLQQASLEGPGTSSETSSIRERVTPPSAGDSDVAHQQQFQQPSASSHAKAVSADDARRQAGKHAIHDGIQHKRRSHTSRAGKNSALERLPSVHGHLHHMHGHPYGSAHSSPHSRPHSQSSSQHDSPAGGAVPVQSDPRLSPLGHTEYPVQPDVLAWLNPAGQSMLPPSAASMEIDQQRAAGEGPSSWSAYSSSASDTSGAGLPGSSSASFIGNQQPMYGTGFNFGSQTGYMSPPHPGQVARAAMIPGMGSASDSSASSAAGSRRSSAAGNAFTQLQQFQQASAKSSGDQQADMAANFSTGSMRSFADTFSGAPGDVAQWNVDWDLGSISDSGLRPDQVDELLASFPLSHHPWAGDLNQGASATGAGESDRRNPALMEINVAQLSSAPSRGQPEISSNTSGGTGIIDQAQNTSENMLRQMQALGNLSQLQQGVQQQQQQQQQQHHQQPLDNNQAGASTNTDGAVSFASVTFGDPLIREDREGSPDSLELQREQTFTAKDVGKRFGLDGLELNKDVEESDDDQRRRSTDTLRRAEGALDLALESVEDTRALAFAQQFQRDLDSDEYSDEEPDEDGYEEDEEDDNEPDYDFEGTAPDYNFQQVLDELSNSEGMSGDFFDGPFDAEGMGATPGAPGQLGLDGSDLSLYPEMGRSVASRQQQQDLIAQASDGAPTDRSQEQQGGAAAAAAAAGLMNQIWNGGMTFDNQQQQHQQHSMGSAMHTVVPTNTDAFPNVQAAGWTSSPVDNESTSYGMNPSLSRSNGSAKASPGRQSTTHNQQ